jgi:hypothetical protein
MSHPLARVFVLHGIPAVRRTFNGRPPGIPSGRHRSPGTVPPSNIGVNRRHFRGEILRTASRTTIWPPFGMCLAKNGLNACAGKCSTMDRRSTIPAPRRISSGWKAALLAANCVRFASRVSVGVEWCVFMLNFYVSYVKFSPKCAAGLARWFEGVFWGCPGGLFPAARLT